MRRILLTLVLTAAIATASARFVVGHLSPSVGRHVATIVGIVGVILLLAVQVFDAIGRHDHQRDRSS